MKGLFITLVISVLCHCIALAQPNIVSGEYFIDQYVDFGKGQQLQLTPQQDLTLNTTIDVSGLEPGIHNLYLRFKNSEGHWSQASSTVFYKPIVKQDADVIGFEYFFDQYVDFGKGNFLALKEGEQIYTISTEGLEPGLHVLNVRARSSESKWSHVSQSVFYVPEDDEIVNIVRLEYFFKDASGNTTQTYTFNGFTPAPTVELSGNDFKANTSGLTDGQAYTLYVRAFADNGRSSMASTTTFTLKAVTAINIVAIETTDVGCGEEATGKIVVDATGGEGTLQYSLDGVTYSDSDTFEGLEAGDYMVYIKGSEEGYVETREVEVSAKEMPDKPSIDSREEKTGLILFVTNPDGSVQWYKDGQMIEGATSSEIEVKGDGSYHVVVTSTDGCTVRSEAFSVTAADDELLAKGIMVYPNPASGKLNIDVPDNLRAKGVSTIYLYDLKGALVAKYNLGKNLQETVSIKLPATKDGMYLLMLKGEGFLYQKKIIKNSK